MPSKRPAFPGNCAICGVWRRRLQKDHIYPRWKAKRDGWTVEAIEDPANIQRICANCHQDKSEDDLRGMRLGHSGPHSAETRAKIGAAFRGKHHSAETKAKLSVSNTASWRRQQEFGVVAARREVRRLERLVARLTAEGQ